VPPDKPAMIMDMGKQSRRLSRRERPGRNENGQIAELGQIVAPENDFDRRMMDTFIFNNISDLSSNPKIPTEALEASLGLTWTLRFARSVDGVVRAALNSHPPASLINVCSPELRHPVRENLRLLEHLAVDVRYRRAGTAQRLINEAETMHKSEGATLWFGFVDPPEFAALPFYRSVGFAEAADTSSIPDPTGALSQSASAREGIWIYKTL